MPGKILLSTAYLPPVDYIGLITGADEVMIEKGENYIKQTYRNRCYILSPAGPQLLSVPVYEGSRHKILIRDVRIDYSKRWQQVHLRAIVSSYKSSPFFDFYFDRIESIISGNHKFLLDVNALLLETVLDMLKINKKTSFTEIFEAPYNGLNDYRYTVLPQQPAFKAFERYLQVFDSGKGFVPNLSILDLIFNIGPDAGGYLQRLSKKNLNSLPTGEGI